LINALLFVSLIFFASSSQLKRCRPLDENAAPQPPAPQPPAPQPPAPQPPAPKPPAPQPPAPQPPAPKPPAPAPSTIETGNTQQPLKNGACFYMVNSKNGLAVTYGANNLEVGWSSSRGLDQTVCVEVGGSDYYFIHWKKSYNQVFDIYGGGNNDGVRLIKYPKHGGANQRFKFQKNSNGLYQFVAVNSGKAFGIWGNQIAQSTPRGLAEQTWNLIPAN